jgi:integrase
LRGPATPRKRRSLILPYPLVDSLGIERGGLHAFRHTNSTLMDQLGAPFKVRQQRLGHSDVTLMLNAYTHVVGEDDVRLAAQLDGILHPTAPKKENGSGLLRCGGEWR